MKHLTPEKIEAMKRLTLHRFIATVAQLWYPYSSGNLVPYLDPVLFIAT
jgi:hypothetical protein